MGRWTFLVYSWVVATGPAAISLAIVFMCFGAFKLMGKPGMVQEFSDIGIGQWFRYVTGMIEVGAAAGVLIPGFRFWAGLTIAAVMICATILNLTVLHLAALAVPTTILTLVALSVAWRARPGGVKTEPHS